MRERAFAKDWQKNTLEAQKKSLRKQFSYPAERQMRGKNEGFEREKQGKFRNNITILFNIKTKDGGRIWKTRRESIAFKDTTLRKDNFHK